MIMGFRPSGLTCLVTVVALSASTPASAAQSDFCGVTKPSDSYCNGYQSSGYGTWWTYTSAKYYGGGNIRVLYACMRDQNGYLFSYCWAANYATFAGGCWRNNTGFSSDFGSILQHEDTGSSHTIYGHNDDSPNHTGCIDAFAL
jgi:hypothetical protein